MPVLKPSEKEGYWVRYIRNRISKKKNFLCLISGPTGSGKSWAGLSIATMMDKNFVSSRVIFGLKGLMEFINSGENFPPGTCFVWDEFQIEGSSRTWQSLTNRLLNSLLTTFRHKNFILIITSPYSDFIDSNSRKLLHAELEIKKIDYHTRKTKIKPQLIQYNSRNKKFYYKYLRVKTLRGNIAPVVSWSVPAPPKWLIEEYEHLKTRFTTALNKDIQRQLENQEKGFKPKPLTERQRECIELMEKYKDTQLASQKSGLSTRLINFHLFQARKKGYSPKIDEERREKH